MRFPTRFITLLVSLALLVISCESEERKEERLAHQYCSSCHMFPEPALLNKRTWKENVLPQMAFRMGLKLDYLYDIPSADLERVLGTIPDRAMVTQDEWDAISNYFIKNAPDSLSHATQHVPKELKQFAVEGVRLNTRSHAWTTLLKFDSINDRFYLGTRSSMLYTIQRDFRLQDSLTLDSPPSDIAFLDTEPPVITTMGIMDPNDQAKGRVSSISIADKQVSALIDSLQRPVNTQPVDLDRDGDLDYIVSAFGNYTGSLLAFENRGKSFVRHVIQNTPGARRVIIKDFNKDDLPDFAVLLTQGDEQIVMYKNEGAFKFDGEVWLRFPPVYGSSYFDLIDMNKDGSLDVVYSNGDNADYSPVFKPYHGVRIFKNNGHDRFEESWFYPMYGASKVMCSDFDGDQDIDLAAISFFPDFAKHPEHGFLYFENTPDGFVSYTTSIARAGRWLVMEVADIDKDHDDDIILGALNFPTAVPHDLAQEWQHKKVSLLLLRNNY